MHLPLATAAWLAVVWSTAVWAQATPDSVGSNATATIVSNAASCADFPVDPMLYCQHVMENCAGSDSSPGRVNYLSVIYCSVGPSYSWLGAIAVSAAGVFYFLFLGTTSADYLLPNLSSVARYFQMSEEIAGVTLIALGNTINDLVGNIIAFSHSNLPEMALGQIVGSGLVLQTIALGAVGILAGGVAMPSRAYTRELIFYAVGLVLLAIVCLDGVLAVWESLLMLALYVFYVVLVWFEYRRQRLSLDACRADSSARSMSRASGRRVSSYFPPSMHPLRESARLKPLLRCENIIKQFQQQYARTSSSLASALLSVVAVRRLQNIKPLPVKKVRFIDDVVELQPRSALAVVPDSGGHGDTANAGWFECCPICSKSVTSPNDVQSWKLLKYHFLPIYPLWSVHGKVGKALSLLTWWPTLLLSMTVPVIVSPARTTTSEDDCSLKQVQIERSGDGIKLSATDGDKMWHHTWILILQVFLAPTLISFAFLDDVTQWSSTSYGAVEFPFWPLPLIAGFTAASVMFAISLGSRNGKFRGYELASLLGIVLSLAWIYAVSRESVGIIRAMGFVFGMPDAIVGLTMFTLGGSVSDLASNLSMAWLGFPLTAVASITGAPLMNLLMSLGVAAVISPSGGLQFSVSPMLMSALFLLLAVVVIHLITFNLLTSNTLHRSYGMLLIAVYVVGLTALVVAGMW